MLHNGTQQLFDYWNEIRGDARAPARVDISPAAIASILPSTFILEQDDDKHFSFRLAGTALCLLFGQELKGHRFCNLLDHDDRNLARRLLTAAQSERIGTLLKLHAVADADRAVDLEAILLPLSDTQPRLLGAIHALQMPYWAGAEPLTSVKIADVRLFDADVELFSLHNRPAISMTDRETGRSLLPKKPRFAVLQGGAMLGGPQANRFGQADKRSEFQVFDGGRE